MAERRSRLGHLSTDNAIRATRAVDARIAREWGIEYQTRSGLIALLHRLGVEHRQPNAVSRKLDPEKQAAFIKKYEDQLNHLAADEAVIFADAVSNPRSAAGWLLGAERGAGRGGTE